MNRTGFIRAAVSLLALLAIAVSWPGVSARQNETVAVDRDDIGGVVTGPKGPEAGVWVIAETRDLPTRFIRIVVTDDRGRYLVPDLPAATYDVWVRGYGLIDSAKTKAAPGRTVNLTAVPAPNAAAAAEYYPASYWYSLLQLPDKSEFPGTGANGLGPGMRTQGHFVRLIKTDGCEPCHQLGNKGTRTLPKALGSFPNSVQAWQRRLLSGQAAPNMMGYLNQLGPKRTLEMYADWTDRIAAGELPPAPPRPAGIERNFVITQWDWVKPGVYLHDEVSTDKRNPSVNANGPLYGSAELSADVLPVLNPATHTPSEVPVPVRDASTTPAAPQAGFGESPYWGAKPIWNAKSDVHNPIMDHRGRVWYTSRIRLNENQPAFCKAGSSHPSAKLTPTNEAYRHLAVYDPKTRKTTMIDTCFTTHHLFFAEDASHTLWTSSGGGGGVVGWLNTAKFDATGDEAASQGWTALVRDNNGNGTRDEYTEGDQPVDAAKDRRLSVAFYGMMPSPADGSVWGSILGFPGALVRLAPGANPPATALAEIYEVPWDNPGAKVQGFAPRGMDVDRNGVVWTVLASGHYASFDRRKCTAPLNGPKATGQHCPEGWTLHETPGPKFKGSSDYGSADSHYYNWVDQFDTLGMGRNVPIATGNGSDSMLVLDPRSGRFTTIRVPYPLGFFAKGMDGRIDDPRAGWKGKGIWTTWATRTPFHTEGGTENVAKVVRFQLRPNPLAK